MNIRISEFLKTVALLAVVFFCAPTLHAQATRTWVSGVGNDALTCSRIEPCRTFAGALSKTAAGGEISVLDPGGYSVVTITKSITIDGSGSYGSILGSFASGVTINAGVNDVVVLRGLDINGVGTGLHGVRYQMAKAVHIEDVVINGFTTSGIKMEGGGYLSVKNSVIRNGAGAGTPPGIEINSPTNVATVVIDKTSILNWSTGLVARNNSRITMRDSVSSGNAVNGVLAEVLSGTGTAEVNLDRVILSGNNVGIRSAADQTVRISDVMTSHNVTGLSGAGTIVSFGNNRVNAGNTAPGAPTQVISPN